MKASLRLTLSGFMLIAVTYGLARFAWGMMMPQVAQQISFSPRASGMLAACSYLAYCLATPGATLLLASWGVRSTAIMAALTAMLGLLLLAAASSAWLIAGGLFIAGLGAGLASPALASAVSRKIDASLQTAANTLINAGTGAGIIVSVPIFMLVPGGWRAACCCFAALALISLLLARYCLPAGRADPPGSPVGWRDRLHNRALQRVIIIAFLSGVASAAWWCFGPDVLRQHSRLNEGQASMLWLVSGAAGILGALTGPLARCIGMRQVYWLAQLAMAAPLLLLAALTHFSYWLVPAAALCGAGYVTLSGILLVAGAAATPQNAASGVAAAFLTLAIGQIGGAILFAQIYSSSAATALLLFAAIPVALLFLVPANPPQRADA
ncbi:MFS transporter [Pantoea dispersa]|uniref:MFS transporter n=1 Tax=Pantoea dispersa TaxID=59814 RepID=A0A8E1VC61_9GAMM|nr:MFS transporter [Pantoea dispersa]KTR91416.1 MFS transporter [Pantoea dispersa]KTS23917.1 MFS transporter [Pantoea dispersa]KTS56542.1 MFS transporter [Pantoea dispersa]KTS69494.1 MFS transporter [Pantoea dispersa]